MTEEKRGLQKNIGLLDAMMMVVGIVIGSGIFFKSSVVFDQAGTPSLGILAWLGGGVIAMASALTISEIATAIPETGGVFVYLRALYSEKLAFLFGWMQSVIYIPAVIAALSIIFVTQLGFFTAFSPGVEKGIAIGMIAFLTFINCLSTKVGSKVQTIATFGKLVPLVGIIAFGLLSQSAAQTAEAVLNTQTVSIAGFGAAILGTLWAYDGWIGVTNIAGEVKSPHKNLPRAIIIGLGMTIGIYVLMNLAILKVLPMASIVGTKTPAADAAVVLFGSGGARFVTVGIMVSIFGAINGYMITGVRIPYAMACENLYPFSSKLKQLSPKFNTPAHAFVAQSLLASLYVLSGSFDVLTNLAMLMVWVFFTITVFGIFIMRTRRKDLVPTYRVPLYPIVPIIGIIGGVYIAVSTVATEPLYAVVGVAVTLLGLPVYSLIKKRA